MFQGWWVAFGFSGLSVTVGALVWLIRRDRRRAEQARREELLRTLRQAESEGSAAASELMELMREKTN
jgi:hypothetical protein